VDLADEGLIIERRSLTRLFPALRLVGAIRLAFDLRKLVIAVIGLAALQLGWLALGRLAPASLKAMPVLWETTGPASFEQVAIPWTRRGASELLFRLSEPVRLLIKPLLALFDPRNGWRTTLCAGLALVWMIIVWSVCGGAIARVAVVQIATTRQTGIGAAVQFARKRAGSLVVAPLCPLLGVAFLGAILAGFGLLYRIPAVGPAVAGVLLGVPFLFGLVMALLVLGLIGAWPLMPAAIAAGADDALDAMSRTFGYVNQRIGPLVAMVGLASLLGVVGLVFVDVFVMSVVRLTQWGLGLTAPGAQLADLFTSVTSSSDVVAARAHSFWIGFAGLLAYAWTYSFFWTAAAYVYLWLRHDVDGTPWTLIDPPAQGAGPASASADVNLRPSGP
jgi:hypothetical protein